MQRIRCLLALFSLGAPGFARPAPAAAQNRADHWQPRTVPLYGVSYAPSIGLLIGVGVAHTRYAFRALPPSTQLVATASYATGARTYRVDFEAEFRRPLAPSTLALALYASGLEITRFYGVGNGSDGSGPDSAYDVRQTQLSLAPTVSVPLAPRLRLAMGPVLKHARTHVDPGTVLQTSGRVYGTGDFGAVGARAMLELDTRDHPTAAARGVRLILAGQWYPGAWDVVRPFGVIQAEAATYVSAGDPPQATLALRTGVAGAGGTVPFSELVYVGGSTTVRGYPEQRFTGRSGAYANAELRLRAAWVSVGDLGFLGLADAGRVWGENDGSRRWHTAAGGGVWFVWQHRRASTVSVVWARGSERAAVYVRVGFMF